MFQIRIGQKTPILDECLRLNRCTTWAFITAWNPNGSPEHDLEKNIERNARLLSALHQTDCIVLPAWGIPDAPIWPPEASFLILGITKEVAASLSNQFEQHAFVFGKIGGKARLCSLSKQSNDSYYATTYETAPLQPDRGQSLDTWLQCLGARRLRFSDLPSSDCIFQHSYHDGYLCWMKD